jgi:CDP-diacylglycerol--serine O-phosphatidyltransferase
MSSPLTEDDSGETPANGNGLRAALRRRGMHFAQRRLRIRRRRRRAYIRSVYFLPSLATLGNGICGFAAMYVAGFDGFNVGTDPWAQALYHHRFLAAPYLVFMAMVFDALDGRLARFARHTTDFGGQLDSLADVISFGAAPAFLVLQVFKSQSLAAPLFVTRLIWAMTAFYLACAMLRLARFNVSNAHGEQYHFSFLGLPSPGAAGAVVSLVLMQQSLLLDAAEVHWAWLAALMQDVASFCAIILPAVLLLMGLLMVSPVRYPHVVNRYLRGRRSMTRLIAALVVVLLLIVSHRYTLGVCMTGYALWGAVAWAWARRPGRKRPSASPAANPA